MREDPHRSKETSNTEVVEAGKLVKEEALTAEKIGVVYSGMSASVSALTEFAIVSAEGYADLLKNWEDKNTNYKNFGTASGGFVDILLVTLFFLTFAVHGFEEFEVACSSNLVSHGLAAIRKL
nr:nitrate regulatory gene2 protein [Ipomoea batatas]